MDVDVELVILMREHPDTLEAGLVLFLEAVDFGHPRDRLDTLRLIPLIPQLFAHPLELVEAIIIHQAVYICVFEPVLSGGLTLELLFIELDTVLAAERVLLMPHLDGVPDLQQHTVDALSLNAILRIHKLAVGVNLLYGPIPRFRQRLKSPGDHPNNPS